MLGIYGRGRSDVLRMYEAYTPTLYSWLGEAMHELTALLPNVVLNLNKRLRHVNTASGAVK